MALQQKQREEKIYISWARAAQEVDLMMLSMWVRESNPLLNSTKSLFSFLNQYLLFPTRIAFGERTSGKQLSSFLAQQRDEEGSSNHEGKSNKNYLPPSDKLHPQCCTFHRGL